MTFEQRVLEHLVRHEGVVVHMYLDTRANVTTGIGELLEDVNDAARLAWVERDGRAPASAYQVAGDWNGCWVQRPVQLVRPRTAAWFRAVTRLDLAPGEAERCALERLRQEFWPRLRQECVSFDEYPESARLALTDMAYNLGAGAFNDGRRDGLERYVKLLRAAEDGDWRTCAAECHRRGIPESRNDETVALFLAAGGIAPAEAS
jgi:GH24 family phage-related lysozyme (muramidase)